MLERFYPKDWAESTYAIDFGKYYDQGFRGIIFDIDNTLVPHGKDADERAIALFQRLKSIGFEICLLSNNKKPRVERFNRSVNVNYIFKAQKPYSRNYYVAAIMMRTSVGSTLCVGDQLLTDICGGNLAGTHTILVNPIDRHEEIQIVLKRALEAVILFFYRKRMKKQGIICPKRRFSGNEEKR